MAKLYRKSLLSIAGFLSLLTGFVQSPVRAQSAPDGATVASQTAPSDAAAQPAADAANTTKTQKLETVQVTGSMIRSVDVEAAQPVITISAKDIERQGFATIGQLLQNVTVATGSPDISKSDSLEAGADVGGTFIDLRNLGAARTLVLIDGRRMGTSYDGLSNLDFIPVSMVDRIDILADAASVTYGSDAIAGVVNIITKKDFDGARVDTYVGQYKPHSDGTQQQYSFLAGKVFDRGAIEVSVLYQRQDAIPASARPWSNYPLTHAYPNDGWSSVGSAGQILNPDGSTSVLNAGADPRDFNNYHTLVPPTIGANGSVTNTGDYFNANPYSSLISTTTMRDVFVQGHYDFRDNLKLDFSAIYAQDVNNSVLIGYPLGSIGTSSLPAYSDLTLSPNSYYYPTNYSYNASGQAPMPITFQRRVIEDPRLSDNLSAYYRYNVGLSGNFAIGDHQFQWDAFYYITRSQGTILNTGNFYLPNLANALGPSFVASDGTIQCGTPGNVIAGCVPLNALGTYTPAMLAYINRDTYDHYGAKEQGPQIDLSGDIFALPAGDLTFAAGASHRTLTGFYNPDPIDVQGLTSNLASLPTSGSYNLSETWLELNVPILKDQPMAKSLTFNFAWRYSDYNNFGGTNNVALKLTWQPVDDLMLRGSYGTGFRAPTVGDLYGGISTTYPTYTDPCDVQFGLARYNATAAKNCANGIGGQPGLNQQALNQAGLGNLYTNGFVQEQAPQTLVTQPGAQPAYGPFTQGGNPNLQPETSYSFQVGFVYSPSWLEGFNATIDYFHYNIRNLISVISAQQVLNNCYQLGVVADCGLFQRSAATDYQVVNLFSGETNQGWQKTSGYDFNFTYTLPDTSFGKFTATSQSTYVSKLINQPYSLSPVEYNNGINANFRLRSTFFVAWAYKDWGATWSARYFSPLKVPCYQPSASAFPCTDPNYYQPGTGTEPLTRLGSVVFQDISVYWNTPWKGTITLGANDVFNRLASFNYGNTALGSDTLYSYIAGMDFGRFVWLRYSQKF